MNFAEYLAKLTELDITLADNGIDGTKITVQGYLLGDGIFMKPEKPFIDGETLHLDYTKQHA
jgi:hypothetical protein